MRQPVTKLREAIRGMEGVVTNDVNGGRFRLAPPQGVRKRR